jgi:hypothetical protein
MRRCRRKEGSSTAACDALALFDELVISGSVDDSKVEMKEIECISLHYYKKQPISRSRSRSGAA